MKVNGLGDNPNINTFVAKKLELFEAGGKTFGSLFDLMFHEPENIMYESSEGYRIQKKTYGEVRGETLRLAGGLRRSLGSLPRDTVIGLYMENGIEWIELFWAILLCGCCPLLMNVRLDEEVIRQVLRENPVAYVVSSGKRFDVPTVVYDEIAPDEAEPDLSGFGSEVWVMSSGTTEQIKVCVYTAEEFYYQINGSLAIIRTCPQMKRHYNGNLKLLTFLPFYHVFGLIAVYIWFAFFSRTFVRLNDMAPETILNTIKRHEVTHVFAVPLFWDTVYKRTVETIQDRGEDVFRKYQKGMRIARALCGVPFLGCAFSKYAFREIRENLFGDSIRFLISGGSDIPEETLSFFNRIGYRLANGYGMTEIGITSVELTRKRKYLCGGFVGGPVPNCEYRIGPDGELQVRGKVTSRYVIENGIRRENGGWYPTRDLAECVNGHYRILGRMDDMVISATGENINPFRIESRFDLDGIRNACLIRSEGPDGITPVLLLEIDRRIGKEAFTALSASVVQRAGEIRFPKDGRIVYTSDPLMRTTDFKLNRGRIARDFDAGAFRPIDAASFREDEEILDARLAEVRTIVAKIIGREDTDLGTEEDLFLHIGVTSLEYFAVIAEVNDRFSVRILPDQADSVRTIRQIYEQVKEQTTGVV